MSTKCIRARATLLDHKGRSSSHGAEGSWLAQPKCPVLSLPHPCLSAEPKAAPQLPSPSLPVLGMQGIICCSRPALAMPVCQLISRQLAGRIRDEASDKE